MTSIHNTDNCHNCHRCVSLPERHLRMIVCPICGNKRCPKATDHHNACTGSNETGQEGSIYQ